MPGWKSTLPLIGPALILVVAGLLWWLPHRGGGGGGAASGEQEKGEPWEAVDFGSLKPGGTIPGWAVVQGSFHLVEHDGRTMLEMQPEPMGEGKVEWSQIMTGGGAVRARMQGERARRAAPRFCVSLHGESEIQLRAVPATEVVEIAVPGIPEKMLASVPWRWQPDRWVWLEFRATSWTAPDGVPGTLFEGRVWAEGERRPDTPTVQYQSRVPPGRLRAIVEGAPYALRPIYYDRIEALRFYR
jgi:hypothetical protein